MYFDTNMYKWLTISLFSATKRTRGLWSRFFRRDRRLEVQLPKGCWKERAVRATVKADVSTVWSWCEHSYGGLNFCEPDSPQKAAKVLQPKIRWQISKWTSVSQQHFPNEGTCQRRAHFAKAFSWDFRRHRNMRPKVPLQFLIEKACEEKNCFPRIDFEKSVLKMPSRRWISIDLLMSCQSKEFIGTDVFTIET